ncbi:DUF636 domain protein [Colletotrichum truncatum]|uniref:DUF636 domain protein n=1 Tax=Colletotrichum truncatum TaxID=5467 RepID=A0ACC3ZD20_COLTU|nr:duf636 domain protein [Colletotrichum truncatum]KAF6797961.1 duf636 domain protein [Colletotrichum truncatum]
MDVSCLCGTVTGKVKLCISTSNAAGLSLSHSDVDRHSTGLLCASYCPIEQPDSLKGTKERYEVDGYTRYFCSVCGCHIFRSRPRGPETTWEVATGVIDQEANSSDNIDLRFVKHTSVVDTKDGGISIWLRTVGDLTLEALENAEPAVDDKAKRKLHESSNVSSTVLPASCACGTVSFHITRPNEESFVPHSGYPDLQYAACAHSPEFMRNPKDEKWWVRADGTKYLAGTCACRSCRLISGFKIQTWTFVPR